MPNLDVSDLVILLVILLVVFGSAQLPRITDRLAEISPGRRGPRSVPLRGQARWSWSDWLVVLSVIGLGLLAVALAVSAR